MRPGRPTNGGWAEVTSRMRSSVWARSSSGYQWYRCSATSAITNGIASNAHTPSTRNALFLVGSALPARGVSDRKGAGIGA